MEEDEDSVILDTWISVLRPSVLPLSRSGDPPPLILNWAGLKSSDFFFLDYFFKDLFY
jgi:hypothetical protein